MPWVILAAALCVLVWFWPRNTLIGLAVVGTAGALVGIAFWGYGVYAERQRELVAITVEPAAEAASRVPPGIACGEGELLVSITNGSGKTVLGVGSMWAPTVKAGAPTSPRGIGSTTITSSTHGARCRPAGRPPV